MKNRSQQPVDTGQYRAHDVLHVSAPPNPPPGGSPYAVALATACDPQVVWPSRSDGNWALPLRSMQPSQQRPHVTGQSLAASASPHVPAAMRSAQTEG